MASSSKPEERNVTKKQWLLQMCGQQTVKGSQNKEKGLGGKGLSSNETVAGLWSRARDSLWSAREQWKPNSVGIRVALSRPLGSSQVLTAPIPARSKMSAWCDLPLHCPSSSCLPSDSCHSLSGCAVGHQLEKLSCHLVCVLLI